MSQLDREQYNWSSLWTREQLKPRWSLTLPTAFTLRLHESLKTRDEFFHRHSVIIQFYSLSASFCHIRTWRKAIPALSAQVKLTKEEGQVEGAAIQKGGCGPLARLSRMEIPPGDRIERNKLTLDTPTLGQTLEDSPINTSYCPLTLDALVIPGSKEKLIYCNKLGMVYPISFAFIRPDLHRPDGLQRNPGNHSPMCQSLAHSGAQRPAQLKRPSLN
ncbi:hypothetical protein M9H77_02888 [Catharanthus roseus]|uniref:Uncharacterized protein n=1 Tax=Catharanthus roseus TaxID=4058 RepID=A0ACC0C9U8_CATRO|nr:hypothetical protein M9H77_02888 [Catharanthus roseus]